MLLSQDFGPIGSFSARFPERHFDLGISEQNLVGVAAGLAHAGKLPFVLAMAPFVSMRSFEQIRDDCALQPQQREDHRAIRRARGRARGARRITPWKTSRCCARFPA